MKLVEVSVGKQRLSGPLNFHCYQPNPKEHKPNFNQSRTPKMKFFKSKQLNLMITAKIAVATSPKKQLIRKPSTQQNVTQTERQKLAQKKSTKNAELNKPVTDQ